MKRTLEETFANVPEVEPDKMEAEDRELFATMETLEKSGKIALRIPKTLHQDLVDAAKDEGVSLNQYCLYKLAQ